MMRSTIATLLLPLAAACSDVGSGPADAASTADVTTAEDGALADVPATGPSLPEQYLRAAPFPRLVIEVDRVPGLEPRAGVTEGIAAMLGEILDKPGGIEVALDGTIEPRGEDFRWSFDALKALAAARYDLDPGPDAVTMHVMILDGRFETDGVFGSTLGYAWGNRHLVVFAQTVERNCDELGGAVPSLAEQVCAATEEGIWAHEIGHVLGLVDNGIPMVAPHRDEAHGAHDVSEACLMYWQYEAEGLADAVAQAVLGGSEPPRFGPQCLADIAAIRDR